MDTDIRIRKLKSMLNTGGMGMILFSFWSVVKVAMELTLDQDRLFKDVIPEDVEVDIVLFQTLVVIFLLLFLAFFCWIEIHIGRNAMAQARGRRYKKGYTISAWILLILYTGILFYIPAYMNSDTVDAESISGYATDFVYIALLVEILIVSHKLKKQEA